MTPICNNVYILARLDNVQEELLLALASANVNVLRKSFRTSLFRKPLMDLVNVWFDDSYWSKILCSTIPSPLHDLKINFTDLEFLC